MNEKIIIEPHVTEKSIGITDKKKYTFVVARNANKHQILEAIKLMYNVHPIEVKIINLKGKSVTYRGKYKGKRNDWKKAIVKLPEKESIKEFALK